ncbi:protein of unknown function [Pseudoxanthomonas wuyuanensis]|uniref:YfiR family protein n=2 Tax=Pseudoxanthomonas wuyuanensis TaxID=1073196 RepID=A0A286DD53_9GAMM|nr:protein of unknown function [Pseudoxanthomonas wuyuanensis]
MATPAWAQVEEAALKAAFVYNIVAFSNWNRGGSADTLVICANTRSSLDAALVDLGGRRIGQRRIAVRRNTGYAGCDVLVHAGDAKPKPADAATLIICDGCQLPDGVSAVALVREGNRIRFDVDTGSVAVAGISLSSQLLRLARQVL